MSKRDAWNERYAAADLVWGSEPNRFVEEALRDVVTGVDFSSVAIERARKLATQRGVDVEFIEADVASWCPDPGAHALVLVLYMHIPPAKRRQVWAHAVAALHPGGELLLVGHARRNLAEGVGGPQDPELLWEPEEITAELETLGVDVEDAEYVLRPFEGSELDAIDLRISGRR
jgi:SAM-dependent methyltransferase